MQPNFHVSPCLSSHVVGEAGLVVGATVGADEEALVLA